MGSEGKGNGEGRARVGKNREGEEEGEDEGMEERGSVRKRREVIWKSWYAREDECGEKSYEENEKKWERKRMMV